MSSAHRSGLSAWNVRVMSTQRWSSKTTTSTLAWLQVLQFAVERACLPHHHSGNLELDDGTYRPYFGAVIPSRAMRR